MRMYKPHIVITESESGDVRFVGIVEDIINGRFSPLFSQAPYGDGKAPWQTETRTPLLSGKTAETKNFHQSWLDAMHEILAHCGDEHPANAWFETIEEAISIFS